METKSQVTQKFTEELKNLLKKYDADLSADDHFQGYAECGQDIRMTVTVPSIYDEKGETVREWTEIDLGKYVDNKD